uniref:DNA replication ATP-dependent helicase/nuclease n=1 Tax=Loa loa TaxID=7209 RepID=A0A1I7VFT6_LOALO
MNLPDGDIMELPESSSWKENDDGNVTNEISDSMVSAATFANLISNDCIPPRKRPKRLSVSYVERDIQDSFIPFGSSEASIINVRVVSLSDDNNDEFRELHCICEDTSKIYRVRLEGIWSSTPVKIGSSLRVIGAEMKGEEELLLNWENGVLIVEHNVLVPCTLIVQGISCRRKAALSHYFKGRSSTTKEMFIGNVVHELFQTAVTRSEFDVSESSLLDLWRKELREQYSEQFFALNLSFQEIEDELCLYFKTIIRWVSTHMPPPRGRNEPLQIGSKIIKVVDVEESIWNPCYGFKGKIDCTLKVKKKNGEQKLVPVELKTGKSNPNTEHVTQVMLYCLALASKQGTIENGLLLYLLDEISKTVSPKTIDLKGILHIRNEIAAGISATSFDNLPGPTLSTHTCQWCNQALSCSLLQNCSASTVTEIFFQDQLKHLKPSHIDYFKRFIRWVLMEWRCLTERNATDKENICRRKNSVPCIKVTLDSIIQRGNRTIITFRREGVIDEQYELFMKGDMFLVLSEESEVIAMASLIFVKENFIDITVNGNSNSFVVGTTYFLERYETSFKYTLNLGNLVTLMVDDKQMSKIRSLIIDMRPPAFSKMKKENIIGISEIVRQLNCDQARAVVKSLMSNDYTIIEGFPGSGKTSTLAVLIRCLIHLGRTVLITSYTHSAVDNLLSKLVEYVDENKILRLGQQTSMKKSVQHLTLEAKLSKHTHTDRVSLMRHILKETPIVACTCLRVATDLLFSYRRFSMTVVDEASLVLEPTVIPAIAASDSFVLVGDHRQLTPLVRSKQARQEGMAKSLLERLTVHQSAVITLHSQYRMNRPIAELSNVLFYEGKLRCANNMVAEAIFTNLASDPISDSIYSKAYKLCISNLLNNAVVFVDTQSYKNPSFCATFGKFGEVGNTGEAEFIGGLCKLFVKLGLPKSDLGIICVYRYHVEQLRHIVQAGVEVNTVDQYQGRDKSVIVLSFVWAGEAENRKSELLADCRRINVAVTRAKHKLILVGCQKSLSSYPAVNAVINAIPKECITKLHE